MTISDLMFLIIVNNTCRNQYLNRAYCFYIMPYDYSLPLISVRVKADIVSLMAVQSHIALITCCIHYFIILKLPYLWTCRSGPKAKSVTSWTTRFCLTRRHTKSCTKKCLSTSSLLPPLYLKGWKSEDPLRGEHSLSSGKKVLNSFTTSTRFAHGAVIWAVCFRFIWANK